MEHALQTRAGCSPERASVCAPEKAPRPVTALDLRAVVSRCTRNLARLYSDAIARGMTDDELGKALEHVIGIMGGSSARDNCPSIAYAGAGLRIWAHWDWPDMRHKPVLEGARTIAMAREIYGIADPSNSQLDLF